MSWFDVGVMRFLYLGGTITWKFMNRNLGIQQHGCSSLPSLWRQHCYSLWSFSWVWFFFQVLLTRLPYAWSGWSLHDWEFKSNWHGFLSCNDEPNRSSCSPTWNAITSTLSISATSLIPYVSSEHLALFGCNSAHCSFDGTAFTVCPPRDARPRLFDSVLPLVRSMDSVPRECSTCRLQCQQVSLNVVTDHRTWNDSCANVFTSTCVIMQDHDQEPHVRRYGNL